MSLYRNSSLELSGIFASEQSVVIDKEHLTDISVQINSTDGATNHTFRSADINVATDTITHTSHGLVTGAKVQVTSPNVSSADLKFAALFTSSTTPEKGSATVSENGGVSVSNGALVCDGVNDYVLYSGNSIANIDGTGTLMVRLKPGYTGSPASNQTLINIFYNVNSANYVHVMHETSGNLLVAITDNGGAGIVYTYMGSWSPVADTEYVIELDFNVVAGATRLFIDGTQVGSTASGTGTRSTPYPNRVVIGAYYDHGDSSFKEFFNGQILSFQIWDTVQHTTTHTPDVDISEVNNGIAPTGLSLSTTYYVIKTTTDTYKLATSLANALAGTALNMTDDGDGVFVTTTVSASGNTVTLYESNDNTNWIAVSGKSVTIGSSDTHTIWHLTDLYSKLLKIVYSPSSGQIDLEVWVCSIKL